MFRSFVLICHSPARDEKLLNVNSMVAVSVLYIHSIKANKPMF